jgi:hypothetical protein
MSDISQRQADTKSLPGGLNRSISVVLCGLTGCVVQIAEEMARRARRADADSGDLRIRLLGIAARIEARTGAAGWRPQQLTTRSREHLGWLRFLGNAEGFADYLDALRRATKTFELLSPGQRWPRPYSVHFRPTRSAFRIRAVQDRTVVLLPTPMLALESAEFEALGRVMFGRRSRRHNAMLHGLMTGAAYQELRAELEALEGVADQGRGNTHDLGESFDRVNAHYFAGRMPRPALVWSRAISRCKFGHYQYADDTVMISRALDTPSVPVFVLDHVMHHELLHKKHGLRWQRGRGHAHTAEFRQEERLFQYYEQADQFLRRLAAGGPGAPPDPRC